MFGIESQWVMEINGGAIKNDEVMYLRINDEAGLTLPTLELSLNLKDESKVKEYTQRGFELEIGIGKETINYTATFQVFKKITAEGLTGSNYWILKIWGVLGKLEYLDKQRTETYTTTDDPKKSNEVWSEVTGRYGFNPDTLDFKDKMLWLQYNITDRKFLDELVWHGFYNNNDPCLSCIRRDSKAVYKPVSELTKAPKGIISNTDTGDYRSNSFEISQNDGFFSIWGCGERSTPMHTLEEGSDDQTDILKTESSVLVTPQILTSGIREESKRFTESQFINDNVHSNWWRAYEQNRILKSSLNTIQIEFDFMEYYDLYPLDYFEILWKKQHSDSEEMIIPVGGNWLAIKTELVVKDMMYSQRIRLAREELL